MSNERYQGDPSDDRSLLFWAAMRDSDLRDKLIALGFIHAKGEGDAASYVRKNMHPELCLTSEPVD